VQQRFDRSFSVDELRAPTRPLSAPDAAHHFYAMMRQDLARERGVDAAGDDNSLVPW
jgi:hypothetical protein